VTITQVFLSSNDTLDGGDVQLGSDYAVPELAPGTFNQASQSVTIPATTLGPKFLIAVADAGGTESETDESNNTFAKKITIGSDLTIASITAPATAAAGVTIPVTVATKNVGGCTTPATTTRLYFSDNNTVEGGDPFQDIPVAALGPIERQTNAVFVTIPAGTAAGKRFLIALSDAGGAVAESKETNTKRRTITIQ
jgi:subtilase family serine protease